MKRPALRSINAALRISMVAGALAVVMYPVMGAETEAIPLWPNGAAGSEDRMDEPENVNRDDGKCNVTNVHHPSITPYLPAADLATGTAIIIAPGVGHRVLCLGHEGDALAEWFAEHGIAAFVLRYRLARESGSTCSIRKPACHASFISTPMLTMVSVTDQGRRMQQVIGQCGCENGWSTVNC